MRCQELRCYPTKDQFPFSFSIIFLFSSVISGFNFEVQNAVSEVQELFLFTPGFSQVIREPLPWETV